MSKHKKSHKVINNVNIISESDENVSTMVPEEESIDETEVEEVYEEVDEEFDTESEDDNINEESTNVVEEDSVQEQPVIITNEQPLSLYKIGTQFINNQCVGQISIVSDLTLAKEECDNARDKNKKSFYVFDKEGNVIYKAEYSMPKDNYYRVGTDWRGAVCINQRGTFINRDEAEKIANESTKLYGMVHNVYDPSGKIIFSAKKKLILLSYKKRGK